VNKAFITCFALAGALFLTACVAKLRPATTSRTESRAPVSYVAITNALNKQDWAMLRQFAKPGMRANEYITTWEAAAKAGHPMRAGKLVATPLGEQAKSGETIYTFEYAPPEDSSAHLLQVVFRHKNGRTELVDFWNWGW